MISGARLGAATCVEATEQSNKKLAIAKQCRKSMPQFNLRSLLFLGTAHAESPLEGVEREVVAVERTSIVEVEAKRMFRDNGSPWQCANALPECFQIMLRCERDP
jgi:hypothetical protein